MYYSEKVIDGVLHFKNTPKGEWKPISLEELTRRLLIAESKLRLISNEIYS